MNIAAAGEKWTILNSLLNERQFSKIQFTLNLNEEGILAESVFTGRRALFNADMKWNFTPWKWTGTKTEGESGQVLFTGKPFSGRPLLGIFSGKDAALKARSLFSYSSCVERAVSGGIRLPADGAGGILYGESEGKVSLLFLPEEIFEAAARNAPVSDYAALQGFWQDKNLVSSDNGKALLWTRAAFIYRHLAGEPPFKKEDLLERQADILDSNYLPLENRINGIKKEFSEKISWALEAAAASREKAEQASDIHSGRVNAGAKNFDGDFLKDLAEECGLLPDGSVRGVERKKTADDGKFEAEAKKLLYKKSASAGAKRLIRRNRARVAAAVVLVTGIAVLSRSLYLNRLRSPTTTGLSARESAEVFFSGMHFLDTQKMQAAGKGKAVRAETDAIANVYVSSKMRDAFSQSRGTYTPELWLYRAGEHDRWFFGLTNFLLGNDAEPLLLSEGNCRRSAPAVKSAGLPLKEKDGQKKTLGVQYYRVYNQGRESPISADFFSGSVELTFVKDRWRVTALNTEPVSMEEVPFDAFEADYNAALKEAGDGILAVELLRKKYPWLPTQRAMHAVGQTSL